MPKIVLVIFLLINIAFNGVVYANSSEDKQEKNPTLLISSKQEDKVKITLTALSQNAIFSPQTNEMTEINKPYIDKEKFLEWLRYKHQQGEYLDISEDLINSFTEEELNKLITAEVAIKIMSLLNENLENMNEAIDKDVTNDTSENMLDFEPVSITDYGDLYNLPKETELSIMESIKQYGEEKKEALALLALAGTGGLLLKKGKELLDSESQSYREYRHNKMQDIRDEFEQICIEKEVKNIKKGKTDNKELYSDKEFWKYYTKNSSSLTVKDNLKNLAEETLCTGVTQQQIKNFIKENNRAWDNMKKTSEVMCKDFDKQISQKYNQDIRTDREKILKVCEKSKIHEAPSIKENIDNFATLAEETQK